MFGFLRALRVLGGEEFLRAIETTPFTTKGTENTEKNSRRRGSSGFARRGIQSPGFRL
jgi:hypothetical protein